MKLSRLIEEFRRRRVFRVAVAYLLVAWIVVQVADVAFEAFEFPSWAMQLLIVLVGLGFPVALALAWAFDVEPGGLRRADLTPTGSGARPPASDDSTGGGLARFSPRGLLWLGAGGLGVALVAGGLLILGDDADVEDVARTRIAVFPFSFRGSDELAYLGEGVVDLLSTKLNGAGELTTVDPNALLATLEGTDAGSIERSRDVARRFGAGSFITGTILEAGGSLEVHARLHDAAGATESEESVRTTEAALLEGLDQIARALLAGRLERESAQMESLAALTTTSTPALKSFLQGEAAFRRGDAETARALFEAAIAVDTTFALAHYRLAVAGSWFPRSRADFGQVRSAMYAAERHADRLSPPTREILAAYIPYQLGRAGDEEERRLRELLRTHPDNVEAWFMLGELLLHSASRRGRDMQSARTAFERTMALDPRQTFALLHLADLAAEAGDRVALDSIYLKIRTGAPERAALVGYYRLMVRDDDPAILDSMETAAAAMDPETLMEVFWRGAATARSPAGLEILAEQLRARGGTLGQQFGTLAAAGLAAGRGRPSEMAEQLRAAGLVEEEADGGALDASEDGLLEGLSYLLALPFLPPGPAALRTGRDRLAAAARGDVTRPDSTATASIYLHGLLSLRLDDPTAAEDALARLSTDTSSTAAYHRLALAAHLAWSRGEVDRTIEILTDAVSLEALERYLYAEALVAAGQSREALTWFGSFPDYSTAARSAVGIALYPYARLRRARLLEELGDEEQAKRDYAEFLEWWGDADPDLQDVVREARDDLRNLAAR